jgi:hydroxyethylthiazole kinase-like uncharacterized protein yjeF
VAVPEALVRPLRHTPSGSVRAGAVDDLADLLQKADVVCVGPGLDDADEATELVASIAEALPRSTRVVLDAYALGALPARPSIAAALAGRLVVTPNTSEAGILLERDAPGTDETPDAAREIAARYGCVVALRSAVATPEGRLWVGGSGQAGLGTSGSGDVLAGIVAGLLARGAEPAQAAVWGAYLHATAGERLAARVGPLGYLARELLDEAPAVLTELSVQY